MTFDLKSYLKQQKERVEEFLDAHFASDHVSPILKEAMLYSLRAGGKRVRPILAIAACEAAGGPTERVLPFAAALECIHTYSLVHDDLPCMDDDDLRRGKPTNHKAYGEATATLVGDGLLTEAFTLMAKEHAEVPDSVRLKIVRRVAEAAGAHGMVGGQQLDLQYEGKEINLEILERIHTHKTGRLLTVAVEVGALAAGVSERELTPFTTYGAHIGFAFQVIDDVLDVTGGEEIGKSQKSDLKKDKATFVALLGVEDSKKRAQQETNRAIAALNPFGDRAEALRSLARYIISRRY